MARCKADEERRARVRATFDLASVGYDRSALRFFRAGAEHLVEFAGMEPGDRVLDVATGTGWAALAAGDAVGPRGRVTGVDLSPGMLARARAKARRRELSNVSFRIADAQHLPYRTGIFDAVLASQAIFFLPDPARGLREWRRVLAPGGRLATSSLGKAAFEPMMRMYWTLLERYGVHRPSPSGPTFETVAECRRYLQAAGFRGIATRVVDFGYALPDTRAWWTIVWHTGMRGGIRRLPPEDRLRFCREHLRAVAALRDRDGIRLPMPMIFAAGRKPE